MPRPYKGKRYTTQGGLQIQGVVVNKAMWDDIGHHRTARDLGRLVRRVRQAAREGPQPAGLRRP